LSGKHEEARSPDHLGDLTEKGLSNWAEPESDKLDLHNPESAEQGRDKEVDGSAAETGDVRTGRDLQHTSPQMVKAAVRKTR